MISWFEKHNKISWTIAILNAIAIFYISSLTFTGTPKEGFAYLPIIYHFLAFASLCAFLLISLIKGNKSKKRLIWIGIIIAIVYGISDEIHQLFVPGRSGNFQDVLTDSAGVIVAGIIYAIRLRFKK